MAMEKTGASQPPYVELNFDNYCNELEKYCRECYQSVINEYGTPTQFTIGWSDGGFWDCIKELYWGAKVDGETCSGTLSPVPDELNLGSLPYDKLEKLRKAYPQFDNFFKNEQGEDLLDAGFYWWPPGEAGHWLAEIIHDGAREVQDKLLKVEPFIRCGLKIAPHDTPSLSKLIYLNGEIPKLRNVLMYTPSPEFLEIYFKIFTNNEKKISQWMEVATKGKVTSVQNKPVSEFEKHKESLLGDDDDVSRTSAACKLAKYDTQGEEVLFTGLLHENDEIRFAACYGLEALANTKKTLSSSSIEKLKELLQNESDSLAHSYCLNALIRVNADGLEEALSEGVRSENEEMRRVAIEGLAKYKVPETYSILTKALADDDESIREAALHTLGEIGETRAIPVIRNALSDKVETVQCMAIAVLGKLRDKGSVMRIRDFVNHENEFVKMISLRALGHIANDDDVDLLLKHLQSETDFSVRTSVITALSIAGTEKAIDAILPELDTNYSEVTLDALKECDVSLVVPVLLELLSGDRTTALAEKALTQITGQKDIKNDIKRWREWWFAQ